MLTICDFRSLDLRKKSFNFNETRFTNPKREKGRLKGKTLDVTITIPNHTIPSRGKENSVI